MPGHLGHSHHSYYQDIWLEQYHLLQQLDRLHLLFLHLGDLLILHL
jgi:hypothetical protein